MSTVAKSPSPISIERPYIQKIDTTPGEILVGSLFVALTDWESVEARYGRRGAYLTTGAMSFRMRKLPDSAIEHITRALKALNIQADLPRIFDGTHEYQMSFSVNKFQAKTSSSGLTLVESRAIERVRSLLATSEEKRSIVIDELMTG